MMTENKKIKILFLCTGNACRSQMAEGWAEYLKGDVVEAYSAGVCPIGVSSRAIKVMAEAGIDISGHKSQHIDEFSNIDFDIVITLCDNAAKNCPVFPAKAIVIHRPFYDPYFATGDEEQIMEKFRITRDQIKTFVASFPDVLEEQQ